MTRRKTMGVGMSMLLNGIKTDRAQESIKAPEMKALADKIADKTRRLLLSEKRDQYFFNNLCSDPYFGNSLEFDEFSKLLPDVATDFKRTVTLYLTYAEFAKSLGIHKKYKLNQKLVSTVVEHYLADLNTLKTSHGYTKVQLPKVAGLMTNLIVKYRPIVPTNIKTDLFPHINELFAVHHGLCICSDFSKGAELADFENSDKYDDFLKNMLHLFNKSFIPENLIMIFETLCLYQFSSFLKKTVDG
jgi:hypothetical protein